MSSEEPTKVDRWLKGIKNHRVLSVCIVVGVIVIGIASFTDAVGKLWKQIGGALSSDAFAIAGEIVPESGATVPENLLVTVIWGLDRPTDQGGDTSF